MSAPNLINASTITGKGTGVAASGTSETSILSNAAASGKVLKVNTLLISNSYSGSVTVTIALHDAAAIGGNSFPVVSGVSIPGNSTLTVIDKTVQIYLEENTSLGFTAGTSGYLTAIVSYEDVS